MEFVPIKKNISQKKKKYALSENKKNGLTSKKSKRSSADVSVEEVHKTATRKKSADGKKRSTLSYFTQDAADLTDDATESVKPTKKNSVVKGNIPRLFVCMQSKILNEEQVKALHPDIIAIRYPRKKRSRWCWAVFKSHDSADKALVELKARKDVKVTKPKSLEDGNEEKTRVESSKLKKAVKKKLKDAWL